MGQQKHSSARPRRQALNLENSRWFVPVVFVALFLAMVFLFSDFIFSNQMMYSSDVLASSLMFRIYQATYMAAHGGAIPQWMPHQFAGMPFVEAFHSDIFYPPSLFVKYMRVWFDDKIEPINIARDLGWLMILHIYIAGIFMYRAARQFKLRRISALVAGACYMFAGYFVSMVTPGHDGKIYVIALFPLMMYFLDRGFEKEHLIGRLKYFSLTGLTIGFILLTPHPQMSYFALWGLSFYSAFKLINIWVQKKSILPAIKPGLFVVYAVVIGLMISAIQMYPGISYTQQYSPRADTKRGWDWATSWSLHQEEVASLVIPEFSGTSTEKAKTYYWGKNAFKDNSEWLGTVALYLAIVGLFFYRNRKEAWFFGGLTIFAIFYGMGGTTPFFRLMYAIVPMVKSMRGASMIMFLGSFSVALLAGMGVQSLFDWRDEGKKLIGNKANYVLFGFPSFILLLAICFSVAGQGMIKLWCTIFYSEASTQLVQRGVTKLDVANMNLPAIQSGAWIAFFFVALAAFFLWLYREGKMGAGIMIALIALPVIDGVRFDSRFIRIVDPREFASRYNETPLTRFLTGQKERFRVINVADVKEADFPVHGIDATVGYHGNQLRWYDDLLGGPNLDNIYTFNPRLLNLTGTKYLINPTDQDIPPNHFGPIPLVTATSYGNERLIRNDNAFPRVFLVDKYIVVTDRKQMVNEVISGRSDMRHTVLLEDQPTLSMPTAENPTDSAWIIDYQPETVTVGVNAAQNAILVLTDTWFPSWQVTVDGKPVNCLRAYGAFRAVEIPAGSREVRFEYHSSRYALGKTVTLLTILPLLGIIAGCIFMDRRRKSADDVVEPEEETDDRG